jgi:hypothetical protein
LSPVHFVHPLASFEGLLLKMAQRKMGQLMGNGRHNVTLGQGR